MLCCCVVVWMCCCVVVWRVLRRVPYREQHVLLVLVDGSQIGDGIGVLDHTDGLA